MAKLWVPMRCARSGAELVATFVREGPAWYLTETRPAGGGSNRAPAARGIQSEGEFLVHNTYRGCPSCGLSSFFLCACGGVSCFVGGESAYRCGWCGNTGVATLGVFDVKASDKG